jgi:AraC-like DNA-binding protein
MLYLSAVILAFFLSFILLTKKNKSTADYILLAWLAVTGFHLLSFYLISTSQYADFPTLVVLGFPLPLVQGPFLFLYTRQQTSPAPFKLKLLLHFIPLLVSYALFAKFYTLSFHEKVEIINRKGEGFEKQMLFNLYAIYLSGIIYVSLSLITLLKFRRNLVNQFSNTEKINFNWLLYLIIWMGVIWIVILFIQEDSLIFGAAALFVIWLGYFGIKQVQAFSQHASNTSNKIHPTVDDDGEREYPESPKSTYQTNESESLAGLRYQKSSLTEPVASSIHERLKKLMQEEKPFKNPDLTLNELAGSLEVHPNHLSQVINSKEKRNFYDLINERRVDEFISLISQGVSKQYTLLAIAFDCGFNSKASFNRNFKKYTGLSPSDYLKQQLKTEA